MTKLTREFHRLLKQTSAAHLSFACAKRWNAWQRWYHWVARRHDSYQPIFVIASPRSGSNLLIDYLNWLPEVGCLSEVLNWGCPIGPRKYFHPHQILRHLQQSFQTLRTPRRACKIFLRELEHYRLTIDDLNQAFPHARYLVLYRESLAEQFVSKQAALQTGQWVLLPGQQRKQAAVTIDPIELTRFCHRLQAVYATIANHRAILSQGAILSYEQLVADPDRCLREVICPLLGTNYSQPKTAYRKQNVESLADRVANYSAVTSLLNSPLCRLQLRTRPAAESISKAA